MSKTLPAVELTDEEKKHIDEIGTIPFSVMEKRLDVCCKEEELEGGYFSSEDKVRIFLKKKGIYQEGHLVKVQLISYLQEKYGHYIWEGSRKIHSH